jgi:hypothetical protein
VHSETKLTWGHALLDPNEQEIRLPYYAFQKLRRMGLLLKNRNRGLHQLSPLVYEFMRPEYEGLMDGLRRILGWDLSGPLGLECRCMECKRQRSEVLRDLVPNWKELIDQTRPGLHEF